MTLLLCRKWETSKGHLELCDMMGSKKKPFVESKRAWCARQQRRCEGTLDGQDRVESERVARVLVLNEAQMEVWIQCQWQCRTEESEVTSCQERTLVAR
ncbi:hypothetical protein VTJ04DRAFT_4143 [Mycothermus thermophilus]|uniref:uncharacterized protein n=1 Tax=Humicola insolens TaxID=85995 RepID=UPI003742E9F7